MLNNLGTISLIVSLIATVFALIGTLYAIRKDRRELIAEDKRMFQTKVVSAIKASTFPDEIRRAIRDDVETKINDKIQIAFRELITQKEFADALRRLTTIESQMVGLLTATGTIGGKIDTLLELSQK